MGKIFCVMGKSSCGKDTIYRELLKKEDLALQKMILYTTRPMRSGETDGTEYHFVSEDDILKLEKSGALVEKRVYHTIHGDWTYATVNGGEKESEQDYLVIGTLESYRAMRNYYGSDTVIPIYVELEDGIRLARALERETRQEKPRYKELCRRYLADEEDFAEEKIKELGINYRYKNLESRICAEVIASDIRGMKGV